MQKFQTGYFAFLAFGIAAASVLSSCTAISETNASKATAVHLPASVIVFEPALAEKIYIRSQDSRRDAHGVFIARTVLKNESTDSVQVETQTFFKDQNGLTVDRSPARKLFFEPLAEHAFAEKSMRANIRRFVVYMRFLSDKNPALEDPVVLLE